MKLQIVLLLALCFSCGKAVDKQNDAKSGAAQTDTLKLDSRCIQKDTITPLGTKISYLRQKDRFKICWGDHNYTRVYDSLYSCYYEESTGLWDFVPKFGSETKNTVVLTNVLYTSSGANPAPLEYSALILPKNKKDAPFEIDFFITMLGDYLVYGDGESNTIHIINLETRKIQDEILYPAPVVSRSPTMSIHTAKIDKGALYIKYESIDENDNEKIIETTIKIKI